MAGPTAGAAAGNFAKQAFSIAVGNQDKFNWGELAAAAVAGKIEGKLGWLENAKGVVYKGTANALHSAARAVGSSAIRQGLNIAFGAQKKFDWTGLAVAGVAGAVAHGVNDLLPKSAGKVVRAVVTGTAALLAGAATRTLLTHDSFGQSLKAALPDALGSTVGNLIGGAIVGSTDRRKAYTVKEQTDDGGYGPAKSASGPSYFEQQGALITSPDIPEQTSNSYTEDLQSLIGNKGRVGLAGFWTGGQPTARTKPGFWNWAKNAVGNFFKDPIGSIGRAFSSFNFTVSRSGRAAASTESDVFTITGRKLSRNWNGFLHAWSVEPPRERIGETSVGAYTPSTNPFALVWNDVIVRAQIADDKVTHANRLASMRSVTSSKGENFGLSLRAELERRHAAFSDFFVLPYGLTDGVIGRPLDAIGIRWTDPRQNITGHMFAEPAVAVGSLFVGNPQGVLASSGPRVATAESGLVPLSRAEVRAKIFGTAQQTGADGAHAFKSYREAILLARNPEIEAVFLNKGYNEGLKLGPKTVSPNRRPDVLGRYLDGRVDRVEVFSKTDDALILHDRNTFLDPQLIKQGYTPLKPRVVYPVRGH
jgi:hypothetical protein